MEKSSVHFFGHRNQKRGQQIFCLNYLPGGATFNSYTSGVKNNYLYQGKELQQETEIYDFHARGYDPYLVRTWQPDPMADMFYDHSPYSWLKNNLLNRIDPTGMTDFTLNKETGEVAQVGETNDEPDRILKTKQFGKHKGEVKYKRNGEAKVAVGGIEQGILADGQNWKTDSHIIAVGGEGQPSEQGVEAFTLKLSNYVGTEIAGAYFSNGESEITSNISIGMYKGNNYTRSGATGHALGLRQGLSLTGFFHTHPGNGHDISNSDRLVPSDTDLDSRDNALQLNPSLKFFLITAPVNYGDPYPKKIPYATGYSRRLR